MNGLPTGTVTFLFTDVEGSTRRVQELGAVWAEVVEQHDELMRAAVEDHGGTVIRIEGDSVFASFASAADGVGTAVAAQQALAAAEWAGGPLLVRMGLHTGLGLLGGSDYIGIDVHRAARVASSAHGGQIVVSEATAPLIERSLPPGCELVDLGKHRLKDLADAETLLQVVVPGMRRDFPPLNTLDLVRHNLPVQVTSFVGRAREIAEARRLLAVNRILTLLGPGGTGKTRLALQVAAEVSDEFSDGVFFVSLAEVADHRLIASTVLDALGVAPGAGEPGERLQRLLATKSLLLVMDNFEHLSEGATIVSDIVRTSPGSKVLATSRVPLRVSGEQEMALDPLDVSTAGPEGDPGALERVDAVHLFLERAAAVQPDFALTPENAATVVELVRRLDGLPLAIELVVPRLRLLSVEAVLERLDLSRLGGGSRDLPERHRTLWNAVAWSEEALTPAQRNLFCLLAAFAGGGALAEIEAVARKCDPDSDVLEGLAALVETSLLRRVDRGGDRFEMLVVIREYAAERLEDSGKRPMVEEAHAEAYLALAEEAERHLLGRDRKKWLDALTLDHDNLRAATSFFVREQATDNALRIAWAMWRFWQIKGHIYEGRRLIDEVLALPGGEPLRRAKAVEASGGIAWWQGDLVRAKDEYEVALDLQRALGDPAEVANALYNHGLAVSFAAGVAGGDPTGREALAEAEEIYRRLADRRGMGDVNWGLGNVTHFGEDDPAASLEYFRAAIDDYAAAGSVFGEGWARFEVGSALLGLGRLDEGEDALRRGLALLYESGDESAVVLFMIAFAALALARGDLARAYRLAGAAWALRDRSGLDIISIPQIEMEGVELATVEALTGPDAEAYRQGRSLSTAQAVALALETS